MHRRRRLVVLLGILFAVVAVKLGQQVYRWYAYADEREELRGLTLRLEDAGYDVVRTQLEADTLRARIEAMDEELSAARRAVSAYDRHALGGALPAYLYDSYRSDLAAFNRRLDERNEAFQRWKEVVAENHAAVGSYNSLVDSVQAVAGRIGEPFISIPSPAEIASRRGLVAPGARGARYTP